MLDIIRRSENQKIWTIQSGKSLLFTFYALDFSYIEIEKLWFYNNPNIFLHSFQLFSIFYFLIVSSFLSPILLLLTLPDISIFSLQEYFLKMKRVYACINQQDLEMLVSERRLDWCSMVHLLENGVI